MSHMALLVQLSLKNMAGPTYHSLGNMTLPIGPIFHSLEKKSTGPECHVAPGCCFGQVFSFAKNLKPQNTKVMAQPLKKIRLAAPKGDEPIIPLQFLRTWLSSLIVPFLTLRDASIVRTATAERVKDKKRKDYDQMHLISYYKLLAYSSKVTVVTCQIDRLREVTSGRTFSEVRVRRCSSLDIYSERICGCYYFPVPHHVEKIAPFLKKGGRLYVDDDVSMREGFFPELASAEKVTRLTVNGNRTLHYPDLILLQLQEFQLRGISCCGSGKLGKRYYRTGPVEYRRLRRLSLADYEVQALYSLDSFPNLLELIMKNMALFHFNGATLEKLLENCPKLQKLTLESGFIDCNFDFARFHNIQKLTLDLCDSEYKGQGFSFPACLEELTFSSDCLGSAMGRSNYCFLLMLFSRFPVTLKKATLHLLECQQYELEILLKAIKQGCFQHLHKTRFIFTETSFVNKDIIPQMRDLGFDIEAPNMPKDDYCQVQYWTNSVIHVLLSNDRRKRTALIDYTGNRESARRLDLGGASIEEFLCNVRKDSHYSHLRGGPFVQVMGPGASGKKIRSPAHI